MEPFHLTATDEQNARSQDLYSFGTRSKLHVLSCQEHPTKGSSVGFPVTSVCAIRPIIPPQTIRVAS